MNQVEYYMGLPCDLSGSRSKNRFRLELLWGISRMLELMESANDFTIVFDLVCDIEVHLDKGFEFYQIKTHKESQSKYTAKSLVKVRGRAGVYFRKTVCVKYNKYCSSKNSTCL